MCLNCGCKIPADDMGDSRNITLETLAKAQLANDGMTSEETLKNMKETLEMVKPEDLDMAIEKAK